MQSAPIKSSQNAPEQNSPPESTPISSQHGICIQHGSGPDSPSFGRGVGSDPARVRSESEETRIDELGLSVEDKGTVAKLHGKKDGSSNKRSKASVAPDAVGDAIKLTDMPNEILIHMVSNLSPSDLLSITLVCRQLHHLVTHPDAWRSAFARYFKGASSTVSAKKDMAMGKEVFRSDKRVFTRLTALASWRSEYTVRVRLLRSLVRGRPAPPPDAGNAGGRRQSNANPSPVLMHETFFITPITKIHAQFESWANVKSYSIMQAAEMTGETMLFNPFTGKTDRNWSTSHQVAHFRRFEHQYHQHEMYGLGDAPFVGNPMVMDLSRPYGVIYGEGCPAGSVAFRPVESTTMQTFQDASWSALTPSNPDIINVPGMPQVPFSREAVCSIWIAKSKTIPSLSDGVIGVMSGSSLGIVSAYSLGHVGMRDRSIPKGELTARWVLSPGVPIIAIYVDEHYSMKRHAQNRIWAIALNALGEVFYLTKFPKRPSRDARPVSDKSEEVLERMAWMTGRSVFWGLVEPSRRTARPDPYGDRDSDGSYSPRSSWDGMCLSDDQVRAETKEIEKYLSQPPLFFRKGCLGWDMRRRLEVDFAGDDGNFAGESVVVFDCGHDGNDVQVKRYVRIKSKPNAADSDDVFSSGHSTPRPTSTPKSTTHSIFGPASDEETLVNEGPGLGAQAIRSQSPTNESPIEEWRASIFAINTARAMEITTTALDNSKFAIITMSEDPLITNSSTDASSGTSSPIGAPTVSNSASIPGQRARFLACGTTSGTIYIWDIRGSIPKASSYATPISPVRIIRVGSSPITTLATSPLIVVAGDESGAVKAWDPLASQPGPLRTLHSPFTGRLRKKIADLQQRFPPHMDINLSAPSAIVLDPNPAALRGIVAIGPFVKMWAFRAEAGGFEARTGKRRGRRSQRGGGNTPVGTPRNAGLQGFIADELAELRQEKVAREKERRRLEERFGLGVDDEDTAMRMALLMSEESWRVESERSTPNASERSTPVGLDAPTSRFSSSEDEEDGELAEAIRRSLAEVDIAGGTPVEENLVPEASDAAEAAELERVLALSLVEQGGVDETREIVERDFVGKGKGRA